VLVRVTGHSQLPGSLNKDCLKLFLILWTNGLETVKENLGGLSVLRKKRKALSAEQFGETGE